MWAESSSLSRFEEAPPVKPKRMGREVLIGSFISSGGGHGVVVVAVPGDGGDLGAELLGQRGAPFDVGVEDDDTHSPLGEGRTVALPRPPAPPATIADRPATSITRPRPRRPGRRR